MSTFERIVKFRPAWDKRHPEPARNCGIHGVELHMVLKGPLGAISFVIYTNWMLPEVQAEQDARPPDPRFPYLFHKPMAADLGYHSPVQQYSEQSTRGNCEYLDGRPCYYDGSTLMADEMFDVLRREGSDGVWKAMEARYHEMFTKTNDHQHEQPTS